MPRFREYPASALQVRVDMICSNVVLQSGIDGSTRMMVAKREGKSLRMWNPRGVGGWLYSPLVPGRSFLSSKEEVAPRSDIREFIGPAMHLPAASSRASATLRETALVGYHLVPFHHR